MQTFPHQVCLDDHGWHLDGTNVVLRSGAIHYFRIHPEQWLDRLQKAKALGLNAVETYLCWNLHEPHPGEFDFSGILDFVRFLHIAQEVGLYAIVRPGPYICAEWENGGIPPWLATIPKLKMRCVNEPYLFYVNRFFQQVLTLLRPELYSNGGVVIGLQLENEYGNYKEDKKYLRHLHQLFLTSGVTVPCFTADNGYTLGSIQGGSLPELPVTLTFGPGAEARCWNHLKQLRPNASLQVMEFWCGMFDHWGEAHQKVGIEGVVRSLEHILAWGGSFNLYMFCGGTNFGFTNGANAYNEWVDNGRKLSDRAYLGQDYAAHPTSYDYDALLDEAGDPTEKFFAIQRVIKKYCPEVKQTIPHVAPKGNYGVIALTQSAGLWDNLKNLANFFHTEETETMEALGQNFGFILYQTEIHAPWNSTEDTIFLRTVRDRAMVYFEDQYLGCVERNHGNRIFELPQLKKKNSGTLSVLVENLGRINYGPAVGKDQKGLPDGIAMVMKSLRDYRIATLPLEHLDDLQWGNVKQCRNHPRFFRGELILSEEPQDTFLKFPGEKGMVWINGFSLGRYWAIGPDESLYIPGPVLRKGLNEIIVFELHDLAAFQLEFLAQRQRKSMNETC